MRLGNVSPRLLADYRADTVTLDQLMALALTDDHEAQEAAFYDAWNEKGAICPRSLSARYRRQY
jgi:ParB family transcriptional regulator, chromosome partitioning protein